MEKFKIDSSTEVIFENNDWVVTENGTPQISVPKYLYKYFSLNEYSIDSLENDYIYLSNPKDFNDPFDCNRNLIAEKQKELRDWQYIERLNDISDIGIACFSENGMEPLLWSHYANSYRGFCLKFNVESLINAQNSSVKLNRVIYSQAPEVISLEHPFSSYYQYLLKLNNWNYEQEWRLLFQNPNDAENRFYFDKSCIQEISVGYKNMDNSTDKDRELKSRFDRIRKERFNDVPLMTVGPHQTKLELNKVLLKEGTIEDGMEMLKHKFPFLFK
ncbi:Protein of unknown function [Flavobacterium gillisiae]|uniref:DUF2971 domain-containing protein n=1 Tax=Flavobacterium gillisiae TaxID=150146 RepID=A0A1H4BXN0_9FLAO|nr:DUF2971 domain-containing protein [Flavobacterium gillisiae]SEA52592.1 Protein of unknown function [Flavobacterium gillisiae]